jgi:hypothetical protein
MVNYFLTRRSLRFDMRFPSPRPPDEPAARPFGATLRVRDNSIGCDAKFARSCIEPAAPIGRPTVPNSGPTRTMLRGDRSQCSSRIAGDVFPPDDGAAQANGALSVLWPHLCPGISRLRLVRDFAQRSLVRSVQRALFFTSVFEVMFRFETVRLNGRATALCSAGQGLRR